MSAKENFSKHRGTIILWDWCWFLRRPMYGFALDPSRQEQTGMRPIRSRKAYRC